MYTTFGGVGGWLANIDRDGSELISVMLHIGNLIYWDTNEDICILTVPVERVDWTELC